MSFSSPSSSRLSSERGGRMWIRASARCCPLKRWIHIQQVIDLLAAATAVTCSMAPT